MSPVRGGVCDRAHARACRRPAGVASISTSAGLNHPAAPYSESRCASHPHLLEAEEEREQDGSDEDRHLHGEVEADGIVGERERAVPDGMQEHGAGKSQQEPAHDGRSATATRADADEEAGAGREQHVRERREQPAHDERGAELPGTALGERRAEVEDVLGEREPRGDRGGVDEAVDRPVEVRAREGVDEEHADALRRLLDDRRLDHRRERLVRAAARFGEGEQRAAG